MPWEAGLGGKEDENAALRRINSAPEERRRAEPERSRCEEGIAAPLTPEGAAGRRRVAGARALSGWVCGLSAGKALQESACLRG